VRLLFCCLLCLPLLALPLRAEEELLVKVQRELRARKFYFGEINGRATEETVAALKKFQESSAVDQTGQLDRETLRALGFAGGSVPEAGESKLLEGCQNCVLGYLRAWESGEWEREAPFFADVVNYYNDHNVSREFIHAVRLKEVRQWPHRKATMLDRITTLLDDSPNQAQMTARIRMEVIGDSGHQRVRTEDLVFRLEKSSQGWKIAALKLLE
jgi:hypothetical protein